MDSKSIFFTYIYAKSYISHINLYAFRLLKSALSKRQPTFFHALLNRTKLPLPILTKLFSLKLRRRKAVQYNGYQIEHLSRKKVEENIYAYYENSLKKHANALSVLPEFTTAKHTCNFFYVFIK